MTVFQMQQYSTFNCRKKSYLYRSDYLVTYLLDFIKNRFTMIQLMNLVEIVKFSPRIYLLSDLLMNGFGSVMGMAKEM